MSESLGLRSACIVPSSSESLGLGEYVWGDSGVMSES